jgi:hypothetical protein
MDPAFPPAHNQLAQGYLAKQKYAEAIAELKKAIQLSGDSPGLYSLILETYNGSPAVTELLLNTTSTESKIRWAVLTGRCFHSAAVVELRRRGRAIRGVWLSSILTENQIAERLSHKFDGYLGIKENSLSFVMQRSLIC